MECDNNLSLFLVSPLFPGNSKMPDSRDPTRNRSRLSGAMQRREREDLGGVGNASASSCKPARLQESRGLRFRG